MLRFILLLLITPLICRADTTPDSTASPSLTKPILPSTSDTRVVVTATPSATTTPSLTSNDVLTKHITSYILENAEDKSILKMLLTMADGSDFYNMDFVVGDQPQQLRIDILQPDIWVMNTNDIYNCSELSSLWSSAASVYGESYLNTATDFSLDTVTVCALGGGYLTTPSQTFPQPSPTGIYNGERYDLPYINDIVANGVFLTDNFSFLSSLNYLFTLPNVTFVDVNDTMVNYGGLGLAGNPTGSGFLDSLLDNGMILAAGYSLWFYNSSSSDSMGELLLGVVDTKYFTGPFQQFDMIPHLGPKVSGSRANLINRLKLPIVPVDDISVENLSNGQILSIFGTPGDTLAVALDTRSTYSFLPLQTVINLAIQTNALYNTELNRWIVECETVRKANAFINFSIANVNVQVPLNSFLFDAYASSNQTLNFSDGLAACYLAFLPDSQQGYSSFGIPFVTNIYLAVDNTNNKVAIANVNKNVSIALSDFDQASPTSLPISDFLPAGVNESTSSGASVAFMKSDIPFASLFTLPANLTLTYLQASVSGGASESIPARFSGISISNGEIYIGNTIGTLGVLPGASAALASSTSSKGNGNRLGFNNINNNNHIQGKVMVWTSIAFCFLISILLL